MTRLMLLAPFLFAGCAEPTGVGIKPGQQAPDFTAIDADGKPVKLSDYAGKVVLLDFWATWCGPCLRAIPHEKELARKFADKPFVILGVSQDHERKALQDYLARNPLPWTNVYDEGQDVAAVWEVEAIPTFVLIDERGTVRGRWRGPQLNAVEQRVAEVLKNLGGS